MNVLGQLGNIKVVGATANVWDFLDGRAPGAVYYYRNRDKAVVASNNKTGMCRVFRLVGRVRIKELKRD